MVRKRKTTAGPIKKMGENLREKEVLVGGNVRKKRRFRYNPLSKKERKKEEKKERRKERKKEGRKEGKKERKKEGKKERKKERREEQKWLSK